MDWVLIGSVLHQKEILNVKFSFIQKFF
jgi:hypothetical protein